MEERDALSFRANARCLVDEPNAELAAAIERGVEVIDGKADVMDARAPLRNKFADWRLGRFGLEQLD